MALQYFALLHTFLTCYLYNKSNINLLVQKKYFWTKIYDSSHSGRDGKSWYKHHHHALAKPHHCARIFAKAPVIIDVGIYWKFYFQNCSYFKFVWFDFIRFYDLYYFQNSIHRFWISANVLLHLKIDITFPAAVRLKWKLNERVSSLAWYRQFFLQTNHSKEEVF